MERVQVLDRSGKVLYVIESRGCTVSIGRDKKKCGIALAVDAQGVSRIHGSLKWSAQDELIYSDTSTYGTLVDGKVVKGESCVVRDGSRISVGDVELTIAFLLPQSSCPLASSQSQSMSTKNSRIKRKSVTSDSLSNEIKRSKVDVKKNPSETRQSQISSFFRRRSHLVEDDECMILAEDTPQSPPAAKSQSSSSTTVRRRKKQSIFDSNLRPVSYRPSPVSPVTLVEDTQLDRCERVRRNCVISRSINVTCIPGTCEQNNPSQLSRGRETTVDPSTISYDRSETSNIFAPEVSILSNTREKSSITTGLSREPGGSLPIKKARIFDTFSSKTKSFAKEAGAEEITAIDEEKRPDVKDLLKLVSTGKRYDNLGAEENNDEDEGLEIERVVAKLSQLVQYADIERPPKRTDASTPVPSVGGHKSANFKRFKKARQGRFNASLSSANLSCIVAGNADLVDFRQLS